MVSVRNNEKKKKKRKDCTGKLLSEENKCFSVLYSLAWGKGFSSSQWACDCSHIHGTEHKSAETWKLLIFFCG